jgi:hypothetical protein
MLCRGASVDLVASLRLRAHLAVFGSSVHLRPSPLAGEGPRMRGSDWAPPTPPFLFRIQSRLVAGQPTVGVFI